VLTDSDVVLKPLKENTNEEELLLYLSRAENVTERRIVYKHKPVDIC